MFCSLSLSAAGRRQHIDGRGRKLGKLALGYEKLPVQIMQISAHYFNTIPITEPKSDIILLLFDLMGLSEQFADAEIDFVDAQTEQFLRLVDK